MLNIHPFKEFKHSEEWKNMCSNPTERLFWNKIFDKVYDNKINSWAYSNTLCNWYHNRLTIVPKHNLIKNIGFSHEATNTKKINKIYFPKVKNLQLKKVIYPRFILPNIKADKFHFDFVFGGNSLKFPKNIYYKLVEIGKNILRR